MLSRRALRTGQMAGPAIVSVSADKTVATLTLSLAGTVTNSHSDAALHTLRRTLIPSTLGRIPGVRVYVAGQTAGSYDFNQTMKRHLPLVIAFVLGSPSCSCSRASGRSSFR